MYALLTEQAPWNRPISVLAPGGLLPQPQIKAEVLERAEAFAPDGMQKHQKPGMSLNGRAT